MGGGRGYWYGRDNGRYHTHKWGIEPMRGLGTTSWVGQMRQRIVSHWWTSFSNAQLLEWGVNGCIVSSPDGDSRRQKPLRVRSPWSGVSGVESVVDWRALWEQGTDPVKFNNPYHRLISIHPNYSIYFLLVKRLSCVCQIQWLLIQTVGAVHNACINELTRTKLNITQVELLGSYQMTIGEHFCVVTWRDSIVLIESSCLVEYSDLIIAAWNQEADVMGGHDDSRSMTLSLNWDWNWGARSALRDSCECTVRAGGIVALIVNTHQRDK